LLHRCDLTRFIIVATKLPVRRFDGSIIQCPRSSVVLVSKQSFAPLGRRITGPVLKELRILGHLKILSIATIVI
jgi:large subunit ribosomal protein L14